MLFRSKYLIVTCEQSGTPVDLDKILTNAADYPLVELYILNFGRAVSTLPEKIVDFKSLEKLALTKNDFSHLPSSVSQMTHLKILDIDLNPLNQLLPEVQPLHELNELGIAGTTLSENEIEQIQKALPGCKIFTQ